MTAKGSEWPQTGSSLGTGARRASSAPNKTGKVTEAGTALRLFEKAALFLRNSVRGPGP